MQRNFYLAKIALGLALLGSFHALSNATEPAAPTPTELEQRIGANLSKVESFREIREIAKKLGVRVWLFGGTASSFAHYVKRDELRLHGDLRFQPDRFDYHYSNIYHSSQDLDVVVDGTEPQLDALEKELKEKFPYFEGSKALWEVRPLRQKRGDKDALLDDFNFHNQHTDSHSTGMIELTDPPTGQTRVRDLRDWEPKKGQVPQFLRDVAEGKIRYYYSPRHGETRLANEGNNPPILSVIRYFTKALKEELEIRPEDEAVLRRLIQEFDTRHDAVNERVKSWIERNAKKLFQHAVSIEYAAKTLDQFGLRKKLTALGDPEEQGSMAWWLGRKPLTSVPLGKGPTIDPSRPPGKTASELGLSLVSHETSDILAYESITRAHTGDPNVLASRRNATGEAAIHGEGFYTQVGDRGARGTGITIHFRLNPEARENVDFTVHKDYVLLHNKRAFRVVPESLNITGLGALELFTHPSIDADRDKALLAMIVRRLGTSTRIFSKEDMPRVEQIVKQQLTSESPSIPALSLWFSLPMSLNRRDLIKPLEVLDTPGKAITLADAMLSVPQWLKEPDAAKWVEKLIRYQAPDTKTDKTGMPILGALRHWFSAPESLSRPDLVDLLLKTQPYGRVEAAVLSQSHWLARPEASRWIESLKKGWEGDTFDANNLIHHFLEHVVGTSRWKQIPGARTIEEHLLEVLGKAKNLQTWTQTLAVKRLLDIPLNRYTETHRAALKTLVPTGTDRPQSHDTGETAVAFMEISGRRESAHPELVEALLQHLAEHVTTRPGPQLNQITDAHKEALNQHVLLTLNAILEKGEKPSAQLARILDAHEGHLAPAFRATSKELSLKTIRYLASGSDTRRAALLKGVLSLPKWSANSEARQVIKEMLSGQYLTQNAFLEELLPRPEWWGPWTLDLAEQIVRAGYRPYPKALAEEKSFAHFPDSEKLLDAYLSHWNREPRSSSTIEWAKFHSILASLMNPPYWLDRPETEAMILASALKSPTDPLLMTRLFEAYQGRPGAATKLLPQIQRCVSSSICMQKILLHFLLSPAWVESPDFPIVLNELVKLSEHNVELQTLFHTLIEKQVMPKTLGSQYPDPYTDELKRFWRESPVVLEALQQGSAGCLKEAVKTALPN